MLSSQLRMLTVPSLKKQTASIIFLHGSGDTGEGIKEWLDAVLDDDFAFPHIKLLFPSAPARLYTPTKSVSTVWFNRLQVSPFCAEDLTSIDPMCESIKQLVQKEIASGIPSNRIIIGGFSMGGALSFHCGYRFCSDIAGVFALSAFLNENSAVYETIKKNLKTKKFPPLFQVHGEKDSLVLLDWAKSTDNELSSLGIETCFKAFPELYHQLSREVVRDLIDWIYELLPDSQ